MLAPHLRRALFVLLLATAAAGDIHAGNENDTDYQRSGSYIGGGLGYFQPRAWLPETDDHSKLSIGPLHTWQATFRVGDAFTNWFSLGFKLNFASGVYRGHRFGAFSLLIDTAFYPWRGLMLRPNIGLGFGFAQGKNSWEFGGGGPWSFELTLGYEFRVTPMLSLAPVVAIGYLGGDDFDSLLFFAGLEIIKWFATATG